MKKITISKKFTKCGREFTFEVTEEGLKKLYEDGELVSRIFPELSPSLRILLVHGICGECFDKMFN